MATIIELERDELGEAIIRYLKAELPDEIPEGEYNILECDIVLPLTKGINFKIEPRTDISIYKFQTMNIVPIDSDEEPVEILYDVRSTDDREDFAVYNGKKELIISSSDDPNTKYPRPCGTLSIGWFGDSVPPNILAERAIVFLRGMSIKFKGKFKVKIAEQKPTSPSNADKIAELLSKLGGK